MQRIVKAVACLSIIAAAGCKDSVWTPIGSAELVLSDIKNGGAPEVSKRIDSDENFGRSVTSGIATGDTVWLQVANELIPASAAAEATLSIALASALPRSPDKVLALLGQKYPVEEVCGMPFLRADSAEVTTYHDETVAALGHVRAASLSPARDACRTALDDARVRRLERINPSYVVKNKPVVPKRRPRKQPAKPPQAVTPKDSSSSG
ncbi:MAG TPA: hypothetical protein VF908_08285 [Gemmatimonadaceae bacterium]